MELWMVHTSKNTRNSNVKRLCNRHHMIRCRSETENEIGTIESQTACQLVRFLRLIAVVFQHNGVVVVGFVESVEDFHTSALLRPSIVVFWMNGHCRNAENLGGSVRCKI